MILKYSQRSLLKALLKTLFRISQLSFMELKSREK